MNPPQDRTDYNQPNSLDKRTLVGGPVNTVDIDAAMAVANAPGNAVVGTDTQDVPTNKTPTVPGGQQLQMGMEAPTYGWNPGQAGFGQQQVAQIQVDGFNVPVAQKALPFGAVAARMQGIAERKQQLADAKQKMAQGYDPFKGISDPFSPYASEFNDYIRQDFGRLVQDHVDSGEFTSPAEVHAWFAGTAEGKAALATWASQMDSIAKENAGMGKRELEVLAKIQEGKESLDPEEYQALVNSLSAKTRSGAPISGGNREEFITRNRQSEAVLSKMEYRKQYLSGVDKMAEQLANFMPVEYLPGGKLLLKEEARQNFDKFIEAEVPAAMQMGVFKNEEEAKKALKGWLSDKVTFDTTLYDPYESVERKEAAKAKYNPEGGGAGKNYAIGTTIVPGFSPGESKKALSFALFDTVGDRTEQMKSRTFTLPDGNDVEIYAPKPVRVNGEWVIKGRRLDEKTKQILKTEAWQAAVANSGLTEAQYISERNIGTPTQAYAKDNGTQLEGYIKGRDLDSMYFGELAAHAAKNPRYKGITADDLKNLSDEQLIKIVETLGL